ncbi:energy-coupling factor transporter transmembrane component T family protein [Pseudalkalibacillus berkeleyi]|uniref:Energy-coupling factor transporter transmembrane protein EcfT n=1 Tax=Pseudalkalibacillus berkeleyi TaxID=1069813 RepID=A0ABS9H2Y1_9BACL|nr:energy-coupling factor transporter transmembrane component T [Pseudalkalibacillus berkeleyi]MCF6139239.1 energy-coupling factor transporter transmembrane protein EcfT [Pseudalkalibacillus berkeleyi]
MNLDFQYAETWLHKINPTLKLFLMIGMFIFVLFIHQLNWLVYLTVGSFILFWFFSGHPKKRLAFILIPFFVVFISTASSMIFFGKGETTWLKWALIHITEESFYRGIHLGFRALIFATLGLTFTLTTRPVNLFYSLMQQAKLNPKYAYSFMAGMRLIPIMIEEFFTIRNAMKVRGVQQQRGFRSLFFKLKSYSIPLLSQSIRRAHRIAVAMEAKRFTGEGKRTYYYRIGFSTNDGVFVFLLVAMILLSYYTAEVWPMFPVEDVRYES